MSSQAGRGGIGSHKHGVSGHSPRSPRYKFMQALEDNRKRAKPPRAGLPYGTVSEAAASESRSRVESRRAGPRALSSTDPRSAARLRSRARRSRMALPP